MLSIECGRTVDHNDVAEATRRLAVVIAGSRPAAVAGWASYWARLAGLTVEEARAGLEALAARGDVRRVPLGADTLYVADPPHAAQAGDPPRGVPE